MNTVISQVTLFTDESFSGEGPNCQSTSMNGPKQKLRSTFNSSNPIIRVVEKNVIALDRMITARGFYGMYQKWFYTYLATRCNEQTSLTFFKEPVTAVRAGEDNYYVYTQSIEFTANKVILALGHQENELTTVEQELADYAKEHRLFILLLKMRRMLYWHLPIYLQNNPLC